MSIICSIVSSHEQLFVTVEEAKIEMATKAVKRKAVTEDAVSVKRKAVSKASYRNRIIDVSTDLSKVLIRWNKDEDADALIRWNIDEDADWPERNQHNAMIGKLLDQNLPANTVNDELLASCKCAITRLRKTKKGDCEVKNSRGDDYHMFNYESLGKENRTLFDGCVPGGESVAAHEFHIVRLRKGTDGQCKVQFSEIGVYYNYDVESLDDGNKQLFGICMPGGRAVRGTSRERKIEVIWRPVLAPNCKHVPIPYQRDGGWCVLMSALNTGLVEEALCLDLAKMENPPMNIARLSELNTTPYNPKLKYERPRKWYPNVDADRRLKDLVPWLASDESIDAGMILLTFLGAETDGHTILVDCNRRLILDPSPIVGPYALPLKKYVFRKLDVVTVLCARRVYR